MILAVGNIKRRRRQDSDSVAGAGEVVVTMRFDSDLLARVDAAARRQGISHTAWLHVAASKALER
jgi:hypothetical protein